MIRMTSSPAISPGVLGRLALGVVEVGRDRDDRLGHLLAEIRLGVGLELLEDHRADLGRRVLLAIGEDDLDPVAPSVLVDVVGHEVAAALDLRIVEPATHEPLDRVDGVAGLVTAWRFASWPTSRSPVFVNATTDGTVRPPSADAMTVGSPPSMTATTEFVVPRSMPMILPMR